MSKIFKTEGIVVKDAPSKDIKKFEIFNYFKNNEYINYDGRYISLTRLDYNSDQIEYFSIANKPGQKTVAISDGYVVDVSGITIYEDIRYSNDRISRGRAFNNFTERSDLYLFNLPTFSVSGATKIMTGTTNLSAGVYIVNTLSSVTFSAIFSANNTFDTFFVDNDAIKFELYQRGDSTNIIIGTASNPYQIVPIISNPFFSPNILSSTIYFNKTNFTPYPSNFSSVTFTYDLTSVEGEFIIKGLYKWVNKTFFGKLIGQEYSENISTDSPTYLLYNDEIDYYFVYLKTAEKPTIFGDLTLGKDIISTLSVFTLNPSCDNQTGFLVPTTATLTNSNTMVSVNGLVLSKTEYGFTGNTLYIFGGIILTTDIITLVSSSSLSNSPLYTETYKVTSIPNTTYPSTGQKVIFNTSTNKYEYWLDYETINDPVITINGQVLTYQVDYYVSSSNKRRIILETTLFVNDIITAFYNSAMKGSNSIISNVYTLSWVLPNAVKNDLGYFLVELTDYSDTNFSSPIFTGITFYSKNQSIYDINLSFYGGTYGQKYWARITNYKNYYTVLGELIQSTNTSDPIMLTIDTNALNNY